MHYILIFLVALPKGKLNSKKPRKAGQLSASKKKRRSRSHQSINAQCLLLKTLHKFLNRIDLPWVSLVWENYYGNGTLPIFANKGSFWWRDIVKLLNIYKGLASPIIGDGRTSFLWQDLWDGLAPQLQFPELFSFVMSKNIFNKQSN